MYSQLQTSIASSEWSIRWTLLSILKNIIITTLENRTFLKMEGAWTCNLEIRVNTSWKMTTFGDFPRYFSYFRPGHNTKQSYSYNGHNYIEIHSHWNFLDFLTELLFTESESNRRIKRPREYSKILEIFIIFGILIFLAGIHHMGILCLMRAFPNKKNKIWIQEFGLVFTRIGGHKIAVVMFLDLKRYFYMYGFLLKYKTPPK